MIPLFQIGFLPVRIFDILDILIVGYLMYQIYKLLRGSVAFNIFIGFILIYVVNWLVRLLEMDLLASILGQLVSVGVLMLLIIFQPEVRRFLLFIGDSTLRQRSNFVSRLLDRNKQTDTNRQQYLQAIKGAIMNMSKSKTGVLIVLANNLNVEFFAGSGVKLDALVSQQLLETIFSKDSPLHDGAVVISRNSIRAASCILPVSSNPTLPSNAGLRHRAAVGVTESTNVTAFVVSEENGEMSFAREGKLSKLRTEGELGKMLEAFYG
ncbi:MAG: diadenylate cyclase CdaA [Saprospiraceae bacterium]